MFDYITVRNDKVTDAHWNQELQELLSKWSEIGKATDKSLVDFSRRRGRNGRAANFYDSLVRFSFKIFKDFLQVIHVENLFILAQAFKTRSKKQTNKSLNPTHLVPKFPPVH